MSKRLEQSWHWNSRLRMRKTGTGKIVRILSDPDPAKSLPLRNYVFHYQCARQVEGMRSRQFSPARIVCLQAEPNLNPFAPTRPIFKHWEKYLKYGREQPGTQCPDLPLPPEPKQGLIKKKFFTLLIYTLHTLSSKKKCSNKQITQK